MTEPSVGITGFGAYLPRLRLQRKAMANANAWFNPAIMGQGKGERTMANWDEDAVTMAVEASRDALPGGSDPIESRRMVDALFFASTVRRSAKRVSPRAASRRPSFAPHLPRTSSGVRC